VDNPILLLRYFAEDVKRIEHSPWLLEFCALEFDSPTILTAVRASQAEESRISATALHDMIRFAICESAKKSGWASPDNEEGEILHNWRALRKDRELQIKSEDELFPQSAKKRDRHRLFQHCMTTLWEHVSRDAKGEDHVSRAL